MIVCFPAIYPDELVYSWFCRYYVHSGFFYHKTALQELYCKRSDNPSKEFIGNLNSETISLIEKICPLDKLVLNHTMYPQYARFIPLEQKQTALHRLVYDNCDAHHLFCVLPRNEAEQHLRYCPLCVKKDRLVYGETYWHRVHQIRNMSICTKHNCLLIESDVSAKSEQGYTFYPAELYASEPEPIIESNPLKIKYAKYLTDIFNTPINFEQDIPISSVLYVGLSRTKYLKPSGKSRYTKMLADDLNEFYRNIEICSISSIYQIQRVLLGLRSDFSVVCQIAFFFGIKPEELASPSLTQEQIQQVRSSHYMKDTLPIDWKQSDAETAPILEKVIKGIYDGTSNENGRPERISERLVYREMNLRNGQLENMPKCKAIFTRYTESYSESWARKIIWAYQILREQNKPIYWSDIRSISGVKRKNVPSTIPYLSKHADDDTVSRIVDLIT